MINELINLDIIIDRYYIKFCEQYNDNQKCVIDILENVNRIFTSQNIHERYVTDRIEKIQTYKKQLQQLLKLPKTEQRSTEWYEMRKNLITASDFAQALGEGKFGTQKQLFQKKCGYEKDTFDNNAPALKWGVKYESVAIDIYSLKNKVIMHEFGLLPHPTQKWFGASPDSITELGIMVEIKCPWRRKITGEIPKQYMYQIQGQLDVCGLNECDYLECEFLEYADQEEFCRHFNDNDNEKGIIIEYKTHDYNGSRYLYTPISLYNNFERLLSWQHTTIREILQSGENEITQIYYWQIHTYNVVRVYKDESLLTEKLSELKKVWDKINTYKSDKLLYDTEIAKPKKEYKHREIYLDLGDNSCMNISQPKGKTKELQSYAFISDEED